MVRSRRSAGPPEPELAFSARLEASSGGARLYFVTLPVAVARKIGRKGNVPVVAMINGTAEVRASLVPRGGRHRLRLNATVRAILDVTVGDRLALVLRVDARPTADPAPPDVVAALREAGALEAFLRFPVGKQNHILHWIEKAAMETTRAKRVVQTVEVALAARERAEERAARRRGVERRRHPS